MDVVMPQLGETVVEGTVATWHKQIGDRVEKDEILLDVETDKVSMEIPAPGPGRIASILVQAGETVDVGTVLAVIEAAGAATGPSAAAEQSRPAAPSAADAAASTGPTASAARPASDDSALGAAKVVPIAAARRGAHERLSPAVRRLIAEHALDPAALPGTGHAGRITRRDVLGYLDDAAGARSEPHAEASPATARTAASTAASRATPAGDFVPFTRIRRLTAEHMLRSKATSPHVLQAIEVDFSAVDRCRVATREDWRSRHGFSLTYLPFVARAVAEALETYPHINASVEGDGLRLHRHVNLAIAVDLGPEGLVAPVVRAAEELDVAELATAIHRVAERARTHALTPDDLAGGTYTLSNSGVFGTLITAPVINQPQVAILSVDGVRKRPVVIEHPSGDSIAIRPVGVLAQSFDHRAIDGAYSAAFLAKLKSVLEQRDWQVEP
jgi:pyruvate dehydrogenase E2 component (dihydrolipoamide acetyltransferase)